MLTLWDILPPIFGRGRGRAAAPGAPRRKPAAPARIRTMQERYDAMAREQLEAHSVRVLRYRKAMTGLAWQVRYRDGSVSRLIQAPRPRGPMSAAIFLHEIGHHAIGFDVYKPRCLEEYHAWVYSMATMERYGLNITDAVRRRMHNSLWYAVAKAGRRGLKRLPPELEPYTSRRK